MSNKLIDDPFLRKMSHLYVFYYIKDCSTESRLQAKVQLSAKNDTLRSPRSNMNICVLFLHSNNLIQPHCDTEGHSGSMCFNNNNVLTIVMFVYNWCAIESLKLLFCGFVCQVDTNCLLYIYCGKLFLE